MAAAHHCQHLLARGRLPPARRLRLARSVTAHAERAGDTARVAVGLADQIFDHLEAGDVAAAAFVRRDYEDRAAHRRTRFDEWWLEVHRAMLALLEGRWDDAEIHTVSALSIAAPFDQPDAFAIHTAQLFALRWGQGRLEELAPAVTALADDPGGGPVWHAAAALLHAEAGRPGAVAEALAPIDADALMRAPRHGLWSATVALAVRSAALSAQRDRVRKLAPLLDHLHGRFVLAGPGVVCLGAADHYRALVAGTVGRREDAGRLFEAARCHYDRAGAAPWQVWVDLDEARVRLATGAGPHDVAELVERGSAGAATLAMPAAADALVALVRPDRTRASGRPSV